MAGGWKKRAPIVEQLAGPSMCELLAGIAADLAHRMRILDWELTALQARYGRSDAELKAAVTNNFQTKMFNPQTAPLIYVGNQENPARRRSFTVLGVYYPDVRDAQAGLF